MNPSIVVETANPVKNKEGALQHGVERILKVMKVHYEDLLTYDPKGLSSNHEYWADINLGEPGLELEELNKNLTWPEILFMIRGMNRNTTPGKDEVHINVLKIMVREECMVVLQKDNPNFRCPDNVFVDLSETEVRKLLKTPLTGMGKSFYYLIDKVWLTACVPEQWQEVHIVNLFKGGDSENTNNYRGVSLISCAYKVLLCLMANHPSSQCESEGLLCTEQAGFHPHEEAVAQAIALAKIVRRCFLVGHHTLGAFIDFKKVYNRVYHAYLGHLLHHIGILGQFLKMIVKSYSKTQYVVHIGNHLSAVFTPTRGAKQGDPLSSILFDIFINDCLKKVVDDGLGIIVQGYTLGRIPGLMYADDVVILSKGIEDVQRGLMSIYE